MSAGDTASENVDAQLRVVQEQQIGMDRMWEPSLGQIHVGPSACIGNHPTGPVTPWRVRPADSAAHGQHRTGLRSVLADSLAGRPVGRLARENSSTRRVALRTEVSRCQLGRRRWFAAMRARSLVRVTRTTYRRRVDGLSCAGQGVQDADRRSETTNADAEAHQRHAPRFCPDCGAFRSGPSGAGWLGQVTDAR